MPLQAIHCRRYVPLERTINEYTVVLTAITTGIASKCQRRQAEEENLSEHFALQSVRKKQLD